jgi:peptidyl-prolyl cis-trans isomerase D
MLQKLGDSLKGKTWLTYVVFGPLIVIFAAWGAYGIVNLRFGGSSQAAKVNGDTIPLEEVRRAWLDEQARVQQRKAGGELSAPEKAQLQDQVLEEFVMRTLIRQHTRKLGYRVSEDQVVKSLHELPMFQIDGKYSPEAAKAMLAQRGISPSEFELQLRDSLQGAQIENGIRASDFLTPHEVARLRALEDEQRQVRYAVLPVDQFAGSAPVDDAAIQAYYQAHQAQFMNPEYVHVQYAELKLDQLASQASVSDDEVKAYYAKNKDHYVEPERRQARHILIQTSKTVNDAAALKKAEDVLAKAKAGGDFAALAKQYSEDSGSAAQGGDLGFSDRAALEGFSKPLADAVFSMAPNEIRGPIKTSFGYHIVQLTGVESGKTRTLEEARPEIETQLRHDHAVDRFGDAQEQIQQKMEQSSVGLEALAKDFGMQLGDEPQFVRGTGGPPLGNSPELQQAIFSDAVLGEHRVGGPVLIGEDRLVLVRALDHHPASAKPLAEVRDTIIAAVRKERGTHAALEAARSAAEKLKSGAPLDEVLHGLNVTADAARFIGRTDPSVPAQIRAAAFAAAKPAKDHAVYQALALDNGNAALVAVSDVKMDATAPNPQLVDERRHQATAEHALADTGAYIDEMRRTAKVEKNPQALEQ